MRRRPFLTDSPHTPWYVGAFGSHYADLYSHRNEEDARRAVAFILRRPGVDPERGPVLDLCCGAGRHCTQWLRRASAPVVGMDLSEFLLGRALRRVAEAPQPVPLVRGDMMRLPFRDARFPLVMNLFTSFGYFMTDEENEAVFHEIARVLAPGGRFVFDHVNPPALRAALRPQTERETPGLGRVRESRSIDETRRRVEKRIEFLDAERPAVLESVRFYEPEEVEALGERCGLRLESRFGDFEDAPQTPDSPRAVYVFAK